MESITAIRDCTLRCQETFRHCESNPVLNQLGWFQNAQGDFNIWCFGLGASSSGRSSLDFVVRNRKDVRDMITNLLDGLEEAIDDCLEQATDYDKEPESVELTDVDDQDSDRFSEAHFNIKIILKQLTRIHIAIRRYGSKLRHEKADLRFSEVEMRREFEEFKEEMSNSILLSSAGTKQADWFNGKSQPQSLSPVHQRLINANLVRRNRIHYATKHMRKTRDLSKNFETQNTREDRLQVGHRVIDDLAWAEKMGDVPASQTPDVHHKQLLAQPTSTTSASLEGTGIDLRSDFKMKPIGTKRTPTIITNVTRIGSKLDYPHCPRVDGFGESTPCPYCAEPLDIEYANNDSRWRGHLSKDLLPYICVIEPCKTPDEMYATADELSKHIKKEHGSPHWTCDYCSIKLEVGQTMIFDKRQDWHNHILEAHNSSFSENQLDTLSKTCACMMIGPMKCPLCPFTSESVLPDIADHIAEHIHSFALRSLPWAPRNQEAASDFSQPCLEVHDFEDYEDLDAFDEKNALGVWAFTDFNDMVVFCSTVKEYFVRDSRDSQDIDWWKIDLYDQAVAKFNLATNHLSETASEQVLELCNPPLMKIMQTLWQAKYLWEEKGWKPLGVQWEMVIHALLAHIEDFHDALTHSDDNSTQFKGARESVENVKTTPETSGRKSTEALLAEMHTELGDQFSESHALKLILDLENSYVAVRYATAYMLSTEDVSYDSYRHLYQTRKTSDHQILYQDLINCDVPRSIMIPISITWELLFEFLCAKHESAAHILSFMSMFVHPVPKWLLKDAYGPINKIAVTTKSTSHMWLRMDVAFEQSKSDNITAVEIDFLNDINLLNSFKLPSFGHNSDSLELGAIERATIIQQLTREGKLHFWKVVRVGILSEAFPRPEVELWSKCGELLPEVLRSLDDKSNYEGESENPLLSTTWAKALLKAGKYAFLQGKYPIARKILEKAFEFSKPELEQSLSITAESSVLLGATLLCQAEYDKAIKISDHVGNLEPLMESDTWFRTFAIDIIAKAMYLTGAYASARGIFTRCLTTRSLQFGIEHPSTLNVSESLVSILFQEGRFKDAEIGDNRILKLRTQILGRDHPDTIRSISHLASDYWGQGRYIKAETLEQEAVERSTKVLGPEHPDTLTSISNLASIRWYLGNPSNSSTFRGIAETRAKLLGDDHPKTLQDRSNFAIMLSFEGDTTTAQSILEEVFSSVRRILGDKHPDTIETLKKLASVHVLHGRFADAEDMYRLALKTSEDALGVSHVQTGSILRCLTDLLFLNGHVKEAVDVSKSFRLSPGQHQESEHDLVEAQLI